MLREVTSLSKAAHTEWAMVWYAGDPHPTHTCVEVEVVPVASRTEFGKVLVERLDITIVIDGRLAWRYPVYKLGDTTALAKGTAIDVASAAQGGHVRWDGGKWTWDEITA